LICQYSTEFGRKTNG